MERKRGWPAIGDWLRRRKSDANQAISDPAERRRYKRLEVEVPGKVFLPSTGKEADCVVTNISPAGAEIACGVERLLDTPIVLYAAGLGRFDGHIVWERDGSYGVKFSGSESRQARLADRLMSTGGEEAQGSDRQRDKHIASSSLAQFTRQDGSVVPCRVLDFSVSGVSVKTNVRPQVGEHVLIGGMVGRVARYHESGIGIEFVSRQRDDAGFRKSLKSLDLWRTEGSNEQPDGSDDETG
jgi:PilZ domain-containing protein